MTTENTSVPTPLEAARRRGPGLTANVNAVIVRLAESINADSELDMDAVDSLSNLLRAQAEHLKRQAERTRAFTALRKAGGTDA